MAISYNKLWKLLVDKKMSKAAGIAPNTMTRLRRDEEVTLTVLNRTCSTFRSGYRRYYGVFAGRVLKMDRS